MKLVWFPAWNCQNYTAGQSYGQKCPYCPYSIEKYSGRLLYNNVATGSDDRCPASDLVEFFSANFGAMQGFLEVSGGEPLLRIDLHEILAHIPHRWAITSNTLLTTAIDRLILSGAIERCVAWTASWHPHSGREASYERSVRTLAQVGMTVRATVVVAESTVGLLAEARRFLETLPIAGINWHLDAHGNPSPDDLKRRADEILGGDVVYLAGTPPRGRLCNRHDRLMAVGPDGSLYQCVTFAYTNVEPLGKVTGSLLLESLPQRVEWCDHECFACCDHVKHEQ